MKAFLGNEMYEEEEAVTDIERGILLILSPGLPMVRTVDSMWNLVHRVHDGGYVKGCMAEYSHTRYPLHESALYGGQWTVDVFLALAGNSTGRVKAIYEFRQ